MKPYKDLSGNSGVLAYETGNTFIKVKFKGESDIYVYDHKRPGKKMVEQMKKLAVAGKGLSTYISQEVRANFSRKE